MSLGHCQFRVQTEKLERLRLGKLNVEVSAEVTDEELEELRPSFFNRFEDEPKWELEESEGIWGDDQMEVVVISEEPTPKIATAKLVRNSDGDLELVTESQ